MKVRIGRVALVTMLALVLPASLSGVNASAAGSSHPTVAAGKAKPPPDFGAFDNSAGYVTPIPTTGRPSSYISTTSVLPADSCTTLPDGSTWSQATYGYDSTNTVDALIYVGGSCTGGTNAYLVYVCWQQKDGTWRCLNSGTRPSPGADVRASITPTGKAQQVVLTESDSSSSTITKQKVTLPSPVVGVGVVDHAINTKGTGGVNGFARLQFTGVTADGQPLAASHPTALVWERNGQPVAAPSDIGADGASFTVNYVGG